MVGSALSYTLVPSGLATDTITFSDSGGGGSFNPSSIVLAGTSTTQTIFYTPSSAGTKTLTFTSADGGIVTGSPVTLTVSAAGYSLTGPTSGFVGSALAYTLVPSAVVTDVITLSDGGVGGSFSPSSLILAGTSAPQTFSYTPSTAGTKTLTITSADGGVVTASPVTLTVSAVGYSLTGPTRGFVGAPLQYTLVPASNTTDVITFSDGGVGGSFSPSSLVLAGTSAPQMFFYTPGTVGTKTLTITSADGGVVTASPVALTVSAVGYSLTGATRGIVGAPLRYTLVPASNTTDVITLSDGGAGGTFLPTSLTFSNSSVPKTFSYTPASIGTKTLTISSGGGGNVTGSPVTLTVSIGSTGLPMKWFPGLSHRTARTY